MLMTDRVSERRRAAQLARHYGDQEGLAIAEIARRLGRAESTVKAYLYDPIGDKAREVKGPLPGRLPGLRRADQRAQRQGRRVRYHRRSPRQVWLSVRRQSSHARRQKRAARYA